jgi:hypothetical protein
MLSAENALYRQAKEPTEPIERMDPADPIDRIEPVEPIDRIEPLDPIERIEPDELAPGGPPSPRRARAAGWSRDEMSARAMRLVSQAGDRPGRRHR